MSLKLLRSGAREAKEKNTKEGRKKRRGIGRREEARRKTEQAMP